MAEAQGSLVVDALPPALEPLLARGLMFARGTRGSVELVLPAAYLVQLRSWEGEDPRGIRALLAQAPFETTSAIAAHYLGRPATPPIALSLEAAWDVLGDPAKLAEEIEKLSATERASSRRSSRRAARSTPKSCSSSSASRCVFAPPPGATPSRRGVGFSLERRGLLVPVHPNRHVVPTEVGAIIGASADAERASAARAGQDVRRLGRPRPAPRAFLARPGRRSSWRSRSRIA